MLRPLHILLHWLGFADHPEPWGGPEGDFYISDKDRTCEYLSQRFPPTIVEKLGTALGFSMVARIKGRWFLISKDYVEDCTDYRVTWRGKDAIITVRYSAAWEREIATTVRLDPSDRGYWAALDDPLPGYQEYMHPLSAGEFEALTAHIPRDAEGFPIVTPPGEDTLRITRSVPRQ